MQIKEEETDRQLVEKTIERTMGKLPPYIVKKLGEETSTLRKCIRSVITTKAKLVKLEEDLKELNKGKLPAHKKVPGSGTESVALNDNFVFPATPVVYRNIGHDFGITKTGGPDPDQAPKNKDVKGYAFKFYHFVACCVDITVAKEHISLMQ